MVSSSGARRVERQLQDTERNALQDALDEVETTWIDVIDNYQFPVVTLSENTEADALCTIFETLNRTGVKLSVFELLTARFWPRNINLRALWEKALADHPLIGDFKIDPYYVLQGIALSSRKVPSCKRSDVLNMAASDIAAWWDKVVLGLATGLEILRDDCKVMLPKWVPYKLCCLRSQRCLPGEETRNPRRPAHTVKNSTAGSGARSSVRFTRVRQTARRLKT